MWTSLLQKHGVEYNVLTTVNWINAEHSLKIYGLFRDEPKISWIQFIPVVDLINEEGNTLYQKGNRVSNRSVLPKQLGSFLIHLFDEWVRK